MVTSCYELKNAKFFYLASTASTFALIVLIFYLTEISEDFQTINF